MARKMRATQGAVVNRHGIPTGVAKGDEYDEDDVLVRDYGWLFQPLVETATASPGERRTVARKRPA